MSVRAQIGLTGALALLPFQLLMAAPCDPAVAGIWTAEGEQKLQFHIEVADDTNERAQGLMGRQALATTAGMLFVYEAPRAVSFWMKNTLIPLDMIFMDQAGRITHVHAMAKPLDETPIPGGEGVQYVLEIGGGLAATFGIAPGMSLSHPSIDAALAAVPCD